MYVVCVRKDSNYVPFPTQLAITRFIVKSIHVVICKMKKKRYIYKYTQYNSFAVKETSNGIDNCLDLSEISLLKAFSLVKHNDK